MRPGNPGPPGRRKPPPPVGARRPNRVPIGSSSEVPSGTLKTFDVAGHAIVVARVGDRFCAVAARCPHMGGPIGKGKLEGNAVVCPTHGSRFDMCSGRVLDWVPVGPVARRLLTMGRQPTSITSYRVTEQGGRLYIEL